MPSKCQLKICVISCSGKSNQLPERGNNSIIDLGYSVYLLLSRTLTPICINCICVTKIPPSGFKFKSVIEINNTNYFLNIQHPHLEYTQLFCVKKKAYVINSNIWKFFYMSCMKPQQMRILHLMCLPITCLRIIRNHIEQSRKMDSNYTQSMNIITSSANMMIWIYPSRSWIVIK